MKKYLSILFFLLATALNVSAEEITVWEDAEGYAGNVDFAVGSNLHTTLMSSIAAGDLMVISYTDTKAGDQLYLQNSGWDTYSNDITGITTANLSEGSGSYEVLIYQAFINEIQTNGLKIRRNDWEGAAYKFTKVTIIKDEVSSGITVWNNSAGLADNLRFAAGSGALNNIISNLSPGDVFTIYYTGAHEVVDPSSLSKTNYNRIYINSYDFMTNYAGDPTIIVSYDDVLHYVNGSKDFYVTQNFINAITANGITLQRGKTEYGNFKYTKITISHPNVKVPGYEILYDGAPHPIAWGKDTYPVPKRMLLNLASDDIIHAEWGINEIWDAQSWTPYCMRLVSQYNNSNTIGSHNVRIYSTDDPKAKSFTLTATDIETIKATELVVSGYYFNLNKLVLEHPSRFVSVTMNADGLATFSHATEAVDVTWVDGLKAYTATVSGDKIVTEAVTEAVPANTGLILYGEPDATYRIPFAASANEVVGNVLQPTDGSAITGYVLAKDANLGIGFFKVTNKVVAAGKAYIPNLSGARKLSLDFLDEETTGIDAMPVAPATQGAAYNMMGQRVSANSKGLVIINGKKYINK